MVLVLGRFRDWRLLELWLTAAATRKATHRRYDDWLDLPPFSSPKGLAHSMQQKFSYAFPVGLSDHYGHLCRQCTPNSRAIDLHNPFQDAGLFSSCPPLTFIAVP
jgi:hypothetical protein